MDTLLLHPFGRFTLKEGSSRRMALAGFLAAFTIVSAVSLALLGLELQRRLAPARAARVVEISQLYRAHMMQAPAPAKPAPTPPLPRVVSKPAIAPPKKFAEIVPVPETQAPPEQVAPSQNTGAAATPSTPDNGAASAGANAGQGGPPDPNAYVYVEEFPVLLKSVPPVYPAMAREAGMEGQVLLKLLVGTDGTVQDVRIEKGNGPLGASAVAAARQYKFKPAYSNHQAVAVWVAVPITFKLRA